MVQTRSKSSLSTNVIPSSPLFEVKKKRRKSKKQKNNNNPKSNADSLLSSQDQSYVQQKEDDSSLQLEDINSIPDPPTPPNLSTLHKSVAVAVANVRRRRVSSSTRRLSSNNGFSLIPLHQQGKDGVWKSETFFRKKNKEHIQTLSLNQRDFSYDNKSKRKNGGNNTDVTESIIKEDARCNNDSDMSLDESIDQLPYPFLNEEEGEEDTEITNGSYICYDDSSEGEKKEIEGEDRNRYKNSSRRSMFHKIDQLFHESHCLSGDSVIDGREKRTNVIMKKKKRKRRSILLPGEEDDEKEIDSSHSFKQKQPKRCMRKSFLLPNEEMDNFYSEKEKGNRAAAYFRNLKNYGVDDSSSCNKTNRKCEDSSSTVSSTTATGIFIVEQSKKSDSSPLSSLIVKSFEEERYEEEQRKTYRNFSRSLKKKLNQMKSAVRKFCSIPPQDRYKSDEAIFIEELCGYPIITSVDKLRRDLEKKDINIINGHVQINDKKEEEDKFRITNEMRRSIIDKMVPVIGIMEARKKEETKFVEACTGCCVERVKGKFKYFNLKMGSEVKAPEYQKLYLDMVKKKRLELRQQRKEVVGRQQESSIENEVFSLKRRKPNEYDVMENKNTKAYEHKSPRYDNKRSAEQQLMPEKETESSTQVISETKVKTLKEEEKDARDGQYCTSLYDKRESYLPNIPSSAMTLDDEGNPMNIDNLSPDPEMAKIQTKLFSAIDIALRTYSDEVLILQERRNGKKNILCKEL